MIGVAKEGIKRKKTGYWAVFSAFTADRKKSGALFGERVRNCDCHTGELTGGVGVVPSSDSFEQVNLNTLPADAVGVFDTVICVGVGSEDRKGACFIGVDGWLYWWEYATSAWVKKRDMGTTDVTYTRVRDKDRRVYNIFTTPNEVVYCVDGSTFVRSAFGPFRGTCVCQGRLFVASSSGRLVYSEAYKPSNWSGEYDDGGELFLPTVKGEIRALAASGGFVYVFTQKGVFRLTVAADARDMRLEEVSYAGGEVCLRSAVASGEGVLFLASDGAYFAKGLQTTRVCEYLDIRPIATEGCRVGRCGQLVLIDYRQTASDGTGETARVAISAEGEYGFFCDADDALCGNDFTVRGRTVYRFVGGLFGGSYSRNCVFQSAPLTLGKRGRKTIYRVCAKGRGEVTLLLSNGSSSHTYPLRFEDGEAEIRLLERGEKFVFAFSPQGEGRVQSFAVAYTRTE